MFSVPIIHLVVGKKLKGVEDASAKLYHSYFYFLLCLKNGKHSIQKHSKIVLKLTQAFSVDLGPQSQVQ